MEKKIKRSLLWAIVFITASLSLLLINQFFQQDEWHSFGLIQSYGVDYLTLRKPLLGEILSDRIGARVLVFSFYKIFGLNSLAYGMFAVFIHFLNTFLVYLLCKAITNKKVIAIFSSSFFLVNSVGYQAYSWFGTMMGSAVSLTFILISFIFYIIFLQQKKYIFLFLSVIAIFISFLFKEVAITLLLLYPLLWIINPYRKKTFSSFIIENGIFIVYGLIIIVLLAYTVISISGNRANYIEPKSAAGLLKLLNHAVVYPLQGIVQPFIPSQIIFESARWLTILFVPSFTPETSAFDAFYQTKMTEGVVYFLAFILLAASLLFYIKTLKKASFELRFAFVGSFLFLLLSYVPYVVLDKFDAYLDSRYYYVAIVPTALIFGIFSYNLCKAKMNLRKVVIISLSLIFVSHIFFLFTDLFAQYKVSRERQSIISQFMEYVPNLSRNTIFFVTGNSPGYYGIPELKVPFQSGLGQVLTTVYVSKQKLTSRIFLEETFIKTLNDGFLYDTLAQGYKKADGQGFGYYYDKELLLKDIAGGKFRADDVFPFFYNSDSGEIQKTNIN